MKPTSCMTGMVIWLEYMKKVISSAALALSR